MKGFPMRIFRALFSCLAATCAVLAFQAVSAVQATARPNIVLIQTDDQPIQQFQGVWRDLYNRDRQIMPNTMNLVRNQGIEFTNYITPFPLCAPSRASLLSGQYAQNHGVIRIGGARGGWDGYRNNRINNENLPVWLQRSGYRTAHFGKFINHYGGPDAPTESTVPPGWDRWVTDATDNSTREFYGYQQNIDGEITPRMGFPYYDMTGGKDPLGCPDLGLDVCNYHTDSMSEQVANEIRSADKPFYFQLDYHTPHGDSRPPIGPEPAIRDYDTALKTPTPNPPGFNEADVSDKPWFLRDLTSRLTAGEIQQLTIENRKSVEALQSVDRGVKKIVDTLAQTGKLRNTYIIYTSDNGFFLGQHRIHRGKLLPYEPAVRVPFVMRGPGIKKGSTSREPVANQDIAPTILKLTGAKAKSKIDGRPMNSFWKNTKRHSRRPLLLSSYQQATRFIPGDYPEEPPVLTPSKAKKGAQVSAKAANHNYVGIRVGPYKYVNYEEGESELYVIPQDPHELDNRYGKPRYRKIQAYLERELTKLRACKGASCRAPVPKWPKPPAKP
jgi:N-acetylglucosamine-6-sulfatase